MSDFQIRFTRPVDQQNSRCCATLPCGIYARLRVQQDMGSASPFRDGQLQFMPGQSTVTESILVTKLQIHLVNFPYLHLARPSCFKLRGLMRRLVHTGMVESCTVLGSGVFTACLCPCFHMEQFMGLVGHQTEQKPLPFR